MRADHPDTLAAVVILRSRSGTSLRDLSTERLAASLEPDRAPREAADTVRRTFESRGFTVVPDAHLPTLRLQGPATLFASCFGVPEASLQQSRS